MKSMISSSLLAITILLSGCGGGSTVGDASDTDELLPEITTFTTLNGVHYALDGDSNHVMDVYLPDGVGPFPALIYIHGGGWTLGGRKEFQSMAQFYACRGIAAFSIDYQLATVGQPSWPVVVQDVVCAVRHIRENASVYRINPQLVGTVGFSAGGHLASLLGTLSGDESLLGGACGDPSTSSRVTLVMDYAGPTDFEFIEQKGISAYEDRTIIGLIETLLGTTYTSDPGSWREASPATYITADDPVFVIAHGTNDSTVPVDISQSFASKLEAARVETHLVIVEGARHDLAELTEGQNMSVRYVLEPILYRLFFR